MKKKISGKTKRRVTLIVMLTIGILVVFSLNVLKMLSQINEKNLEASFLKEEILRLQDEEAYLRVEVEKFNDPDYVARYARERYLYSKDGEFTIKIPEAQ